MDLYVDAWGQTMSFQLLKNLIVVTRDIYAHKID